MNNNTTTTFKMQVVIYDPKDKSREKTLDLTCRYFYDSENYGNGHYLSIRGANGFDEYLDLRYDMDFDSHKKTEYLIGIINRYWSGKNGSFKVKSFTLEQVEE